MLNDLFTKFCNPTQYFVTDEFIVVKFEGQVIFRLHLPKKSQNSGIKIYKTCDKTGYTHDMEFRSGKHSYPAATSRATAAEQEGHNLQVEHCCSSPALFDI
jgi:hypothetical protein